jgi:hypothetical protein
VNRRLPLFSLATLALVVMALAWLRRDANHQPATAIAVATASRAATAPFLMYRTLAPPRAYGRVTIAPLDRLEPRRLTPLRCTRVHYGGNRGLCLSEHAEGTTVSHVADVFDSAFRRHQRIELAGVPTRVRVSPDGRLASVTTYAEEESPAGERLAIESVLIDLAAGRVLADLREFALQSDDHLVHVVVFGVELCDPQ